MLTFASISARRLTTDPEPWLYADGTRHDAMPPMLWAGTAGNAHLIEDGAEYAPRLQYQPTQSTGANPILDAARDTAGDSDVWGWAMGWAFAACTVLEYVGRDVPAEYGYQASYAGAAADLEGDGTWEMAATVEALGLGVNVTRDTGGTDDDRVSLTDPDDIDAATWERAGDYAAHAARVLHRYTDAARAAGLDY